MGRSQLNVELRGVPQCAISSVRNVLQRLYCRSCSARTVTRSGRTLRRAGRSVGRRDGASLRGATRGVAPRPLYGTETTL
jgi:hypothetical protein